MAVYKLSDKARAEIDDITVYTALNFGPAQAISYTDGIHDAAQLVADFPSMGIPYTTKSGTLFHRYNIGRHALFYRPMEGGVFVVRILHLMMDFDRHL